MKLTWLQEDMPELESADDKSEGAKNTKIQEVS